MGKDPEPGEASLKSLAENWPGCASQEPLRRGKAAEGMEGNKPGQEPSLLHQPAWHVS